MKVYPIVKSSLRRPPYLEVRACVHIDIGFILCYALFAFIVVACGCVNNDKLWLVAVGMRILYVLWISKRYAQQLVSEFLQGETSMSTT